MLRPIASANKNKVAGLDPRNTRKLVPLIQANLGGGMDTYHDVADIADNAFALLKNVRTVGQDSIARRPGSVLYEPLKPDSSRVMNYIAYNRNNDSVLLLRFNPAGIHISNVANWLAATPTSGALTGGDNDRFTAAIISDRFFFTNNGVDYVQEYDPSTNSFDRLGNADKYKFVTGFGARTVVANLQGASPNPVQIGWSGLNNYDEFSPLTDNTAGFQPLTDSTSDRADFISGIFGGSNSIVIFRERSIWEGTNTNSPTKPFNFYSKINGVGCDAPYSIKKIPLGFCFLDSRTRSVYLYTLDGGLESIDLPIRESLFAPNLDPNTVFGAYNQKTKEYQVAIPDTTSLVTRVWTYSFVNKTWSYDEYNALSSLDVLDYSSSTLTYNDLIGTYDDLLGDYDDLTANNNVVTKFLGYDTGELAYEAANADDDWGTPYEMVVDSKDWELDINDMDIAELRLNYNFYLSGTFQFEYSRDSGNTWKIAKTITPVLTLGLPELKIYKKTIHTRRLKYRITATSGLMTINKFGAWISQSGDSRNSK